MAMEALIRKEDSSYEWINVKPKGANRLEDENGMVYAETRVLKVKHDSRVGKLFCNHCGKSFKSVEDYEEHCKKEESKANCLKCQDATVVAIDAKNKTRIKQTEDGKYEFVTSYVGDLKCNVSITRGTYWSDPKSPDYAKCKMENKPNETYCCTHYLHKLKGKTDYDAMLIKYPDFFEKIPTESTLIKQGWKYVGNFGDGRKYSKGKNMNAYVGKLGEVMFLEFDGRSISFRFSYSKKYDVFAVEEVYRGKYSTYNTLGTKLSSYCTSTIADTEKIVRKLYK